MQTRKNKIFDLFAAGAGGGGPLLAVIGYTITDFFVDGVRICQDWIPNMHESYLNITTIIDSTFSAIAPSINEVGMSTQRIMLANLGEPASQFFQLRTDQVMWQSEYLRSRLNQLIVNATEYTLTLVSSSIRQGLMQSCVSQLSPASIAFNCYAAGFLIGGGLGIVYGVMTTSEKKSSLKELPYQKPVQPDREQQDIDVNNTSSPRLSNSAAALFTNQDNNAQQREASSMHISLNDFKKLNKKANDLKRYLG